MSTDGSDRLLAPTVLCIGVARLNADVEAEFATRIDEFWGLSSDRGALVHNKQTTEWESSRPGSAWTNMEPFKAGDTIELHFDAGKYIRTPTTT